MKVVLVHGAATTGRVWVDLVEHLNLLGLDDVAVVERKSSGELSREVGDLLEVTDGAFFVGVSGGATLGLCLLESGAELAGALLHEPAAGSLAPGLLDEVIRVYASDGAVAFGSALYGSRWSEDVAPVDLSAVGRDLKMFKSFEPEILPMVHPPVLITVGEFSPPIRYSSVRALSEFLDVETQVLAGCAHAAHLEAPRTFAELIAARITQLP